MARCEAASVAASNTMLEGDLAVEGGRGENKFWGHDASLGPCFYVCALTERGRI
jgi:hypothetical protein